ncbi:MAG TPA: hypothetical protein VGJ71_03365, partial [Candidatus Limnocylindrales bacterium]
PAQLTSSDPAIVLAGRDVLVPLTDATITYERADEPTSETFETILVNRAHVTWIDFEAPAGEKHDELIAERPIGYHAALSNDLTRAR